ncbi:hypothetical protein [Chromobacterium subtsugae]|uniref:hypothetical protein n=1 Tax=Chromobacterium subtsugae TaxID=251747 RepID=UPI0007F93E9A|nr:hypothetical protein [Chromobacterium subtsugae]OBU85857.1 hypothetical protein MY55_13570 [Chromobacterium subtsugae]
MDLLDVTPFVLSFIRLGALLLIACAVGAFAAFYVDHRMALMEYPMHMRKRYRTLAFEFSTLAVVVLGSLETFLG